MSYSIVPMENIGLQEVSVNGGNDTSEVSKYKKVLNEVAVLMKSSSSDAAHKIVNKLVENSNILFHPPDNADRNIFHHLAATASADWIKLFWTFDENEEIKLKPYLQISLEKTSALLAMNSERGKKTPLHEAVEYGFVEFLRQVLKGFPQLVNVKDSKDRALIHTALDHGGPEGIESMAIIIRTAREKNLLRDILLNKERETGQIPLHRLCRKVPKHKSVAVAKRLELLLEDGIAELCNQGCAEAWEWDRDETGKTSLHFLCSQENQTEEYETNDNGKQLLLKLLEYRNGRVNEKTNDSDSRTALHLAVINGYHELVEIMVASEGIDVTVKDAHGKMPIHYAAEKGIWNNYHKCLLHLVTWNVLNGKMKTHGSSAEQPDLFRKYLLEETCEGKKYPATALTLACLSKSSKSVQLILKNLNEACQDPKKWFAGKENECSKVFSLRPVFRHTPSALEFLFDKAIVFNEKESNEKVTSFTTDLRILSGLVKPIRKNEVTSEIEYLGYANEWSQDVKEKLLLHPLTQCSLEALWRQMRPFKLFWLLVNIFWLVLYCHLVPFEYEESDGSKSKVLSTRARSAAWGLAIMILVQIAYEFDELCRIVYYILARKCKKLMRCFEINKWSWLQLIVTSVIVFGPCTGIKILSSNWEGFLGGIGILLAFVLFWRNISLIYLPLGIQVEYLIQTVNKILVAFVCCVPIIIGFERAFRQILPKDFTSTSLFSLVRTLVMMTGEFEYTEMFEAPENNSSHTDNSESEEIANEITFKLVAFIAFLLLLPIAFYNLVTGLVVDRIQQMEKTLEVKQILNHIRLINHIHKTHWTKFACLFSWMSFLQPCYITYRFVVDGKYVIYDPELKWTIDKDKEESTSFIHLAIMGFYWCKKCITSILTGLLSITSFIFYHISMSSCSNRRDQNEDEDIHLTASLSTNHGVRTRCGNSLPENVKQRIFNLESQSFH